ncbi:8-oxo-dGTP pyrophosphatase MutT (NUDIX family) [Actinoplanes octamycinicus]|uniref:8-oxo-dGTP pyrophosphatase MutT (NUDIX family) n=1 Tax=Actinoplanes octamycinicus TaxID=135948 RepID=A0A7W7GT49_9ACTN|nr:CoA pyrophosphatase [Actinoplanes octamycinicus]MBB4737834.1 8-oxo-dGTP pyrophosphatase MutT (NUDIX family) [Actinoplanes octamycinicus]GIE59114.1 coenzyme A pyrophosphatase [Actinoplanes octamycinicus]
MSRGVLLDRPADLPSWFEPLLTRAGRCRTEDFSTLRQPAGSNGRSSAVLVLLGESPPAADTPGGPDLLVLQRAATMRNHAGQPAFPGGATDPEDADAVATALREADEEVGLVAASAEPLALLPELWIPVSRFSVTPVLAWWRQPHPVRPRQVTEVAHVARLPISELADPANRIRVRHPSGWIGPAFQVRGMLVWGFTAGVISVLLDMAGWTRPWEPGRVVELPDAAAPVPAARGGAPDEVVP